MPTPSTEFLEPRRMLSSAAAVEALAAQATTQVAGRYVFYNRSAFDGRGAAADPRDDGAIALEKAALRPGEFISAGSVTGCTRGINGVMIDVSGLAAEASLSADDFAFRVGNNGQSSSWAVAEGGVRSAVARRGRRRPRHDHLARPRNSQHLATGDRTRERRHGPGGDTSTSAMG